MGSLITRTAVSVLPVVLAMSTGTAYATQCGQVFQPADESVPYQHIEKTLLDDRTLDQLKDFVEQLDGRWQGTGLEIKCSVSNDDSLTTITNFEVDAEITRHFLGALVLEVEQESKRKVGLERVYISPGTERYDQGQKTGQRAYQVDLSSPDTLVFDEKYRTRRPRSVLDPITEEYEERFAVRLVHEIKTVALNESAGALQISRDIYVNGHFVSQQEWQLTRL